MKTQPGSGNVYADLGMNAADAMLAKAQLVVEIGSIMRERGLAQTAVAELVGMPAAKISRLLMGDFHQISERRLRGCVNRLRAN